MVDKVAMGEVFLRLVLFLLCQYH